MAEITHPAEHWLAVPAWEGFYQVSDHGRVRGVPRVITRSNGASMTLREVVLKPAAGEYGHLSVHLTGPDRRERPYVHRLVLTAFVGPAPADLECCHNDGNAANNRLGNLRWDTPSSNNYDRTTHRTNPLTLRVACPFGHDLVEPNLVAYKLRQGHRSCRACQAAHQVKSRRKKLGLTVDFQAISDAYYVSIMAS